MQTSDIPGRSTVDRNPNRRPIMTNATNLPAIRTTVVGSYPVPDWLYKRL